MSKRRYIKQTMRFAGAPRAPCTYAVELHKPEGVLLKVGMSGNALGRMMSLRSEVKQSHNAVLGRVAIFTTKTAKSAYEAETRIVKALSLVNKPVAGRREVFEGISFEEACHVAFSSMGDQVWIEIPVASREDF